MRTTELMLVLMIATSLNEAAPLYIEVMANETTIISCFPNEEIYIQWHYTAPSGSETYVYAGGRFYVPTSRGFQLKKDSNTGPYHLVIPHARYEDAGLYECKEDIGSRVFGSTQLTVLASNPVCGSNMKSHGYVGPSTCDLEQEYMTFTCAVSYNGTLPQMIWTILNDSQPLNESTCKAENGRINCSLTLKADPKYDGSIFICQSNKSTANCSTDIIKIHYFERDLKLVEKNISDKVNCSVKSNQLLQFNWIKLQGNQSVFVSEGQTLLIQNPGLYRCSVEYRIRNAKCSAFGQEVLVSNPSDNRSETGPGTTAVIVLSIIVVICIVALIIAVVLLYRFRVKKLKRRGINGEEEILMSEQNNLSEDLVDHEERSTEARSQIKMDYKKQNYSQSGYVEFPQNYGV